MAQKYNESRLTLYSLWTHGKRGCTVCVLGVGVCQTNGDPGIGQTRSVFYREVDSAEMHYREISEFLDGRFVPIDEVIKQREVPTIPQQETE